MKQIVEFWLDEDGEGTGHIRLFAFALSPEEHSEVREELRSLGARILQMDGDSIRAEVTGDLVDYDVVVELETKGWRFHDVERER